MLVLVHASTCVRKDSTSRAMVVRWCSTISRAVERDTWRFMIVLVLVLVLRFSVSVGVTC